MAAARVSVIVVSYNTKEKLRRCLTCIEPIHEVIVVDNASTDGSAEMVEEGFPSAKLIRNASNVGFGPANNIGLRKATGDFVLYLNSDAYAEPGAIAELASVFDDAAVVCAGGRLLNTDGSLQESVAARLNLTMVFLEQTFLERLARKAGHGYWRTPVGEPGPVEVAQVMGACLMLRRSLGLEFDERFFLYCEDTELCLRIASKGKTLYVPSARFVHELGSSSINNRWLAVARYNWGKELCFRIHTGRWAS